MLNISDLKYFVKSVAAKSLSEKFEKEQFYLFNRYQGIIDILINISKFYD